MADATTASTADPSAPLLPTHTAPPRRLGVFSLTVIAFFWVSGGIYGNEELVSAGSPALVCGMTLATALLFALPNALMTAELSTAFPEDGGQVVWVQASLGRALGEHNAYWVWLTNLLDAAVYPQLAAHYLSSALGGGPSAGLLQRVVCLAFVGGVACMNMLGLRCVTTSQSVVFVVSLLPCLAFIALGLPVISPAAALSTSGVGTDWALLLSWALWLYSGFSSLGSMAGEVEDPNVTYPKVVALLLPLISGLNILPFAICYSLDADASHYTAGYFAVLAARLGGKALQLAFSLGANVSMLGLYHSQVLLTLHPPPSTLYPQPRCSASTP